MKCICKCCMQWDYCRVSAAYPCYLWQARRKKMPIWRLWNPSSSGKATSESRSLLSLSFIIILFSYTVYRLPMHSLPPPSYCSVFSLSLCSYLLSLYFNSDFVQFFLLPFLFLFLPPLSRSVSLSLVSSLWGSFGSERRFGASLRQYFTLIKRMVGSTVGAAQEHFSS